MKSSNANFDFVAIFLILTEPFIELIYTNSFVFEFVNVIILAGYAAVAFVITLLISKYPNRVVRAVTLTALITLFLDIRVIIGGLLELQTLLAIAGIFIVTWALYLNASKILFAVFGVIFVFIFSLPVLPQDQEYPAADRPNGDQTDNLPVYVHIVLDEQIGTEALDEAIGNQRDLKRSTKSLFIGNGFRLFGRAYSEYFDTWDSLSAMFNAYSGENPGQLYIYKNASSNTLLQNSYLRDLFRSGYTIRVYQTSFMNFCSEAADIIQKCLTYSPFLGISSGALAEFSWAEKLNVALSTLWRRSSITESIQEFYARAAVFAARNGVSLPGRDIQRFVGLGPIPALPVFDQLISDVVTAPKGTMFFAHLMIPHSPYSIDSSCQIRRPVVDWKLISLPVPLDNDQVNTENSRAERYDEYVDQSQCALTKIDELIEALKSAGKFEGSTIIVHGDHGSKISRFRLRKYFQDELIDQDYYDGFSTLFAVKAPHFVPGYDLRMLSLERLLQHAGGDAPIEPVSPEDHFVYLREESPDSTFIRVPMPEIPVVADTPQNAND